VALTVDLLLVLGVFNAAPFDAAGLLPSCILSMKASSLARAPSSIDILLVFFLVFFLSAVSFSSLSLMPVVPACYSVADKVAILTSAFLNNS
jgi:hypothetical protein